MGLRLRVSPNTAILCASFSRPLPIHECQREAGTRALALHTHTRSRTPTHAAVNSDALAGQYYEGVAEGSLIELESRCYRRLAARACNSVSSLACVLPLFCKTLAYPILFHLLMTTDEINCTCRILHDSFSRSMHRVRHNNVSV